MLYVSAALIAWIRAQRCVNSANSGSAIDHPMASASRLRHVGVAKSTACQPRDAPEYASGPPIAPKSNAHIGLATMKRDERVNVMANEAQTARIQTGAAPGQGHTAA